MYKQLDRTLNVHDCIISAVPIKRIPAAGYSEGGLMSDP